MSEPEHDRTGEKLIEAARRLEAAWLAIQRTWEPTEQDVERLLQQRARMLAEDVGMKEDGRHVEVIGFLLAHEHYAIESEYVREVHPLDDLTPVPCTPAFVRGIANVRGEILSVIDIRKFFDLPERGLTDLNKIIVLDSGDMAFGILADAVSGVSRIRYDDIEPSLPTLTGRREDYLLGVTAERTVVLDARKLLRDERLVVRERMEE